MRMLYSFTLTSHTPIDPLEQSNGTGFEFGSDEVFELDSLDILTNVFIV